MKTFKVEAEGDTLYVQDESLEQAKNQFEQKIGPVPASLTHWTEVDALPEGEEAL